MGASSQAWPLPAEPRPVVVIGAGSIVRTAHLPAYRRLGFEIAGVFDIQAAAARETAREFGIPVVLETLDAACVSRGVVFDVAVPGDQVLSVLRQLPPGSPVLIQKPLGEDLQAARAILQTCRARQLVAAVNFQLRFSPNVLALRQMISGEALGEIVDIEVRVQVRQPWHNWPFLRHAPRLEILYHSIHYLDTIRWLAGEPSGVYCRAVRHPLLPDFADTRSTTILDYGNWLRCSLTLNHTYQHGPAHRASMLKVEGTTGAAMLAMAVNLDYPSGPPDTLEIAHNGVWEPVPLRGSWFTEAFEGPMSNLQRFISGEDEALVSPVEDAIRTMALVEGSYESSATGATPVPEP